MAAPAVPRNDGRRGTSRSTSADTSNASGRAAMAQRAEPSVVQPAARYDARQPRGRFDPPKAARLLIRFPSLTGFVTGHPAVFDQKWDRERMRI